MPTFKRQTIWFVHFYPSAEVADNASHDILYGMNTVQNWRREFAKFGSGLVVGDFIAQLWFYQQSLLPFKFLGITFTSSMVASGFLFDLALFLILVHYGWNIGKMPRPRERTYLMIVGVIFAAVALVHLIHIFSGADLVILGWSAPFWLSWLGTVIASYLAYASLHFFRRLR